METDRIARIRERYPAASEQVYLNTAAEGLIGQAVRDGLQQYANAKERGSSGRAALATAETETRHRISRLLGCDDREIAFLGSTSQAINLVLNGLPWHSGDNVVLTELEFPSAMLGCLSLQQRDGVDVRVVPHDNGAIDLARIAATIDASTRLVIVSHVSFHSGFRFDLTALAALVHQRGALLLVDASQSLGAVPVDVADVDFLVACPFKWLLGGHGLGLLYVRSEHWDRLDHHLTSWRGVSDFLGVMEKRRIEPLPTAARFEAGMPSYPAICALLGALQERDTWDGPWVSQRVLELSGMVRSVCEKAGLDLLTPASPDQRAGIVSFRHPAAEIIGKSLESQGVVVWARDHRVRCSPHIYTSDHDVGLFSTALPQALRRS